MIKVTFPDGSVREYAAGSTAFQIAESISPRLANDILAASVNGEIIEINRPITEDCSIKLHKWDDAEAKHAFWHTSAHLMAEALQELYPGIQFGIGPAIESGFYYDVMPAAGTVIKESDLAAIEKKMAELVAKKEPVVRQDITKADALKMFEERGETFKCELINDLEDGTITLYTQGAFTDLCRGPHLVNTAEIKAVKLLSVAGAYWRGDEKRPQMTRIYGISFPKKKMLDEYLVLMEEAKKRDHRKIGQELELFAFSDAVGKCLQLWLPKGTALSLRLEDFLKRIQKSFGYQQVMTPHIGQKELWVTSGHYAKYGKDSFQPIHTPEEGEEYLLKPMNCPHHCEIYKVMPHSYKDLPLRYAEFGTVYRYEQSGELHGLTRVRSFTQDDAHIFCRPDQLKEEFMKVMDIIFIIFKALNFENFEAQISLRDPNNKEKYVDELKDTNSAIINKFVAENDFDKVVKLLSKLSFIKDLYIEEKINIVYQKIKQYILDYILMSKYWGINNFFSSFNNLTILFNEEQNNEIKEEAISIIIKEESLEFLSACSAPSYNWMSIDDALHIVKKIVIKWDYEKMRKYLLNNNKNK